MNSAGAKDGLLSRSQCSCLTVVDVSVVTIREIRKKFGVKTQWGLKPHCVSALALVEIAIRKIKQHRITTANDLGKLDDMKTLPWGSVSFAKSQMSTQF